MQIFFKGRVFKLGKFNIEIRKAEFHNPDVLIKHIPSPTPGFGRLCGRGGREILGARGDGWIQGNRVTPERTGLWDHAQDLNRFKQDRVSAQSEHGLLYLTKKLSAMISPSKESCSTVESHLVCWLILCWLDTQARFIWKEGTLAEKVC